MNILSSANNKMYQRENFMASVPSTRFGETDWIDPLDTRIINLINDSANLSYFNYRGEPITSVSQKFYGTSSLFWVILRANGFLFAEDIPYGTNLKIPDINKAYNLKPGQPVKNRTGTVVVA